MLNTVLASQVTSKACHPYKETAQPEEKKKETDSLAHSQNLLSPPLFYCEEGAGGTETHAIGGPWITKQGCAGQFL